MVSGIRMSNRATAFLLRKPFAEERHQFDERVDLAEFKVNLGDFVASRKPVLSKKPGWNVEDRLVEGRLFFFAVEDQSFGCQGKTNFSLGGESLKKGDEGKEPLVALALVESCNQQPPMVHFQTSPP